MIDWLCRFLDKFGVYLLVFVVGLIVFLSWLFFSTMGSVLVVF